LNRRIRRSGDGVLERRYLIHRHNGGCRVDRHRNLLPAAASAAAETRNKMLVRPTMKEIARRIGDSFSGQELLRYTINLGLGE